MSQKERDDIAAMVQTAKYLAQNDPQGLMLAKNSMDILKARCDLDKMGQAEDPDADPEVQKKGA